MHPAFLFAAALPLLAAQPTLASSEAAWEEFRRQVEDRCRALAGAGPVEVRVHPFGSESYGVALLTRPAAGEVMVCVVAKATGAAEITPPFGPLTQSPAPADRAREMRFMARWST